MVKIVLVEPEIPQNTGNIARLCAGTDTELILIKPLGFSLSDKYLKRAGLDYWEHVKLKIISSFDDFLEKFENVTDNFYFLSKFGKKFYTEINAENNTDIFLIFGNETSGLNEKIHEKFKEKFYKIPMNNKIRSQNLSNSAAIVLYDILRKNNFPDLC